MAQRRLRFIMVGLAAVMVAPLLAPLSAAAAPIDDKQAEAAQLEQQITENGRKLDALNEQINSAQIALDEANVTIATANEQVATASAKAKQLRDELAPARGSGVSRFGFVVGRIGARREERR